MRQFKPFSSLLKNPALTIPPFGKVPPFVKNQPRPLPDWASAIKKHLLPDKVMGPKNTIPESGLEETALQDFCCNLLAH